MYFYVPFCLVVKLIGYLVRYTFLKLSKCYFVYEVLNLD